MPRKTNSRRLCKGRHTSLKQKNVSSIFDVVLSDFAVRHPGKNFWYVDMNAGYGYEKGYVGSPFIFIDNAIKNGVCFRADLMERNSRFYNRLVGNIGECFSAEKLKSKYKDTHSTMRECVIRVWNNDSTVVRRYVDRMFEGRRPVRGIMYSDVNGEIPPFEVFESVGEQTWFHNMDVMINIKCVTLKRQREMYKTKNKNENVGRLRDYIEQINKKIWYIRESRGPGQWVLLYGTNDDSFPGIKTKVDGAAFHLLSSRAGQKVLRVLDYTKEELALLQREDL